MLFSTYSGRVPAVKKIKMVKQKVVRDPEQNLVGSSAEFKNNSGILDLKIIVEKYNASIVTHVTWNGPYSYPKNDLT